MIEIINALKPFFSKVGVCVNHLITISKHKFWVFYYCTKPRLIWRGIKHDLSKFSFTEFSESIKYYTGVSSPIDECKRINGVSYAWMHHKGRNDHHYEYWVDNLDKGGVPIPMPFECAAEMLCDFLGAGRAYSGKSFTYKGEFEWWINKLESNPAMHYKTKLFITVILYDLFEDEKCNDSKGIKYHLSRSYLKEKYDLFQEYSINMYNEFMHNTYDRFALMQNYHKNNI